MMIGGRFGEEIYPVADTVIIRADPVKVSAAA